MKTLVCTLIATVSFAASLAIAETKPGTGKESADAMWAQVESLMQAMQTPRQKPKTREEAVAAMTKDLTEFDNAMAAFKAKHPQDARRWHALLFKATTLDLRKRIGMEVKGDLPTIMNEILQASDAPEEAKGDASAILVLEAIPDALKGTIKLEDWIASAEKHLSERKVSRLNDVLSQRLAAMKTKAEMRTKPFELKFTALDGTEIDLEKLRGKVVLIDFWATWCAPCVAEMPKLLKAYEKLHDKGFEIVGISLDESKGEVEEFVKARGIKWPQYFDGKGEENEIFRRLGLSSIPAMWLLDKKGMVISEDAVGRVEELVEKALKE